MYSTTCKMILQINSGGCHCCHLYILWKTMETCRFQEIFSWVENWKSRVFCVFFWIIQAEPAPYHPSVLCRSWWPIFRWRDTLAQTKMRSDKGYKDKSPLPPTSQSCCCFPDYIVALFFFHSPLQSGLPSKALFFLTCRGAVKNLSQTQGSVFPSFVLLMFVEQEANDKGITCTIVPWNIVKGRLDWANDRILSVFNWVDTILTLVGTNFIITTPNGMRQGKKITLDLWRTSRPKTPWRYHTEFPKHCHCC